LFRGLGTTSVEMVFWGFQSEKFPRKRKLVEVCCRHSSSGRLALIGIASPISWTTRYALGSSFTLVWVHIRRDRYRRTHTVCSRTILLCVTAGKEGKPTREQCALNLPEKTNFRRNFVAWCAESSILCKVRCGSEPRTGLRPLHIVDSDEAEVHPKTTKENMVVTDRSVEFFAEE